MPSELVALPRRSLKPGQHCLVAKVACDIVLPNPVRPTGMTFRRWRVPPAHDGCRRSALGQRVCAGGEEAVALIENRALDAVLLVAVRHGDRVRLVPVVRREFQQYGVEADGVALALQDGALEFVLQHDSGAVAEGGEASAAGRGRVPATRCRRCEALPT